MKADGRKYRPQDFRLFSVVSNSALTDEIDLDLTWIIHFSFDLLSDLSCHEDHLLVVDDLKIC